MDAIDSWIPLFYSMGFIHPKVIGGLYLHHERYYKKIYQGNDLPLQKKTINLSLISFQFTSSVIR